MQHCSEGDISRENAALGRAFLVGGCLDETSVFLSNFIELLKGPRPLFVQTAEICADLGQVGLEVPDDQIAILARVGRITGDKGTSWRDACRGSSAQRA